MLKTLKRGWVSWLCGIGRRRSRWVVARKRGRYYGALGCALAGGWGRGGRQRLSHKGAWAGWAVGPWSARGGHAQRVRLGTLKVLDASGGEGEGRCSTVPLGRSLGGRGDQIVLAAQPLLWPPYAVYTE